LKTKCSLEVRARATLALVMHDQYTGLGLHYNKAFFITDSDW